MKTKIFLLFILVGSGLFYSCDSDDDNLVVSDKHTAAFNSLYPQAQNVSWEKKGNSYVADFWRSDMQAEAEAWFDDAAKWLMTVTEVSYASLPEEVKNGFQSGEYNRWYLDDTDRVDHYERGTMYVIEVKQGSTEYNLYFSSEGKLLQVMTPSGVMF